jgi:hypothetical protein
MQRSLRVILVMLARSIRILQLRLAIGFPAVIALACAGHSGAAAAAVLAGHYLLIETVVLPATDCLDDFDIHVLWSP